MMRNVKLKRIVSLLLTFVLVATLVQLQPFVSKVEANSGSYKIKVLEINDIKRDKDGNVISELKGKLTGNSYEITTMRMKQFVAMRDELAGKYDVIYIGKSDQSEDKNKYDSTDIGYSSNGAEGQTLLYNSVNKKNDITQLKLTEIQEAFVDKGLLVILHNDFTKNSKKYKAYQNSLNSDKKWNSSNYSNVKFVENTDNIKNLIDTHLVKRPRFLSLEEPTGYTGKNDKVYKAGENITFQYSIQNFNDFKSKPLVAKLYIDLDFNLRFDDNELVYTTEVTNSTGTIVHNLNRGYSGVRYWKLEIVETQSGLSDYKSGTFRFQDETVKVKVLQVFNDSKSKLTNSDNLDDVTLISPKNELDYEITIHTQTLSEFKEFGYKSLNGSYDMLIFGFADMYNQNNSSTKISDEAAEAIKQFIKTGQSVMFTHDTIYKHTPSEPDANNSWVKHFKDITGQSGKFTNVGFEGPYKSTQTQIVNNGLITMYPYKIDNKNRLTVNLTHNQYYELDLEDPNVFPWYNMIYENVKYPNNNSGKVFDVDFDDSWNNYYTYSKGTVTYSGTGHVNNKFPEDEQQLFVNTMFQAYVGANHAPVIEVVSPSNRSTIPLQNKIFVSYKVQDFDLPKQYLYTRVMFSTDGENFTTATELDPKTITLVDRPTGQNGQNEKWMKVENGTSININLSYPNAKPGTLYIKFVLQDENGAEAVDFREITLKDTISKLEITRTPVEKALNKNDSMEIEYKITPSPIPKDKINTGGVNALRPIGIKETELIKKVKEWEWKKVLGLWVPVLVEKEEPIQINEVITIHRDKLYPLKLSENQSETHGTYQQNLSNGYPEQYTKDKKPIYYSGNNTNKNWRNHIFNGNRINVGDVITVPVIKNVVLDKPVTITNFVSFKVLEVKNNNSSSSYLELQFNGYVVQTQVDQIKVSNIQYSENFPAGLEVTKPENMNIKGTIYSGYNLTGQLSDIIYKLNGNQYVADSITFKVNVTPKEFGIYTLNDAAITYKDIDGTDVPSQAFNPVRLDVLGLSIDASNGLVVDKGQQLLLKPILEPVDAPTQEFVWKSLDKSIATVDEKTGVVTGVKQGEVVIEVSIKNNPDVKATATVKVRDLSLTADKNTAPVNEPINLTAVFGPIGVPAKQIKWEVKNNGGTATLTLDPSNNFKATLTGTSEGKVTVKVTTIDGNLEATKELEIKSNVVDIRFDQSNLDLLLGRSDDLYKYVSVKLSDGTWIKLQTKEEFWKLVNWGVQNSTQKVILGPSGDKGTITGRSTGRIVVTAKLSNGKSASMTVTVKRSGGNDY